MIDQQTFLTGITLMSNHYDRNLAPSVLGIWKEYLDTALTTEQFQQAVKMTILESRFFPTAKELVEAIKGNSEVQAFEEWDLCVKAAARGEYSVANGLTLQGKFALRAVGGVSELGRINQDDLRWTKKEFISAWKGWKPAAGPVLPPAPDQSYNDSCINRTAFNNTDISSHQQTIQIKAVRFMPDHLSSALPKVVGCDVLEQMHQLSQQMSLNGRANNRAASAGLQRTKT